MAVTATPIYPQTHKNAVLSIVNATGTSVTTLYAAGTNGSKVEGIYVTSTDTSARDLAIYYVVSATNYQLGQISIPITAGTLNTAPSINLLTSTQLSGLPRDVNGNPYLYLASGTTLSIAAPVAVTTAKAINIIAQIEDF